MGVFGQTKMPISKFERRSAHSRAGNEDLYYMGKKNGYIFTNKEHTQKGMMATILGVISLGTLAYTVFMSYRQDGSVPRQYGAATMLAMIFAFIGVILGVVSRTERDKYYLFSYLGIILNVLALAAVSVILYAGAYQ